MNRVIYQFWTGDEAMSDNRLMGVQSMRDNVKVASVLVNKDDVASYILGDHPLHPCYKFLSSTHKADYLRCYFANFIGGGYADIKRFGINNNFLGSFYQLEASPDADIIGQAEIPGGAAFATYNNTPSIMKRLISTCWFIAKPHSEFTELWYGKMISYMNVMSAVLEKHPATNATGGNGYPIPWTHLLGYPFHHTCKELTDRRPGAVLTSLVPDRLDGAYR